MKKFVCVVLTMLFTLGLAASVFAEGIVLKQWYHQYGEEGCQEAVMRYAEEYNALMASQGKDVKVEVSWVAGNYQSKLSAALLTDEAPDVYERHVDISNVKAGHLTPLNDLYTDDLIAEFGPETMGSLMVDDNIYAIKMIHDIVGIYYRKSVFEEAGITVPTTMDELIAAAAKLTSRRVKGLYLGQTGGLYAYTAVNYMIWSAGAQTIADGKIAFDDPRVDAAFVKFGELYNSDSLLIGAPTDWWDPSAFIDGLAAMQLCGMWAAPAIMEAFGDDVGMFPWPAADEQGTPAMVVGGWAQMVNGKSKHIEEAKAFAKWLWIEKADIQEDWSLSYGFHVPPRKSVAAKAEKLQSGVPAEFVAAMGKYGHPENPFWTSAMDTLVEQAIVNIVTNGADPRAEVKAAAEKCQAELDALLK